MAVTQKMDVFDLAWTYARADETPPLIVMRGTSGTGKSVLATKIAPWLGAEVVRSDVVRKELAGLKPLDRSDEEGTEKLYASDMSARTYDEILRRANAHVRAGRPAILDATYLLRKGRTAALEVAKRLGAPFAIVDVTCSDDEVRRRLEARESAGDDASDAGVAVYEMQRKETEPFNEDEQPYVVTVDSTEPAELATMKLLACLEPAMGEGT